MPSPDTQSSQQPSVAVPASPVPETPKKFPLRKKVEDILNLIMKLANNGSFSPAKGILKLSAALQHDDAAAASILNGKGESTLSIISFGLNLVNVGTYIAKLWFARSDFNQAEEEAVLVMEHLLLLLDKTEDSTPKKGNGEEIVIKILGPILGETLKENSELPGKICTTLGLDDPVIQERWQRDLENFRSESSEEAKEQKRKQLARSLISEGSWRKRIRGAGNMLKVMRIIDTYQFAEEFIAYRQKGGNVQSSQEGQTQTQQQPCNDLADKGAIPNAEEASKQTTQKPKSLVWLNFTWWLKAILAKKELEKLGNLDACSVDTVDKVVSFLETLSKPRQKVVMRQLRALFAGEFDGFAADYPSEDENKKIAYARQQLRSSAYAEAWLQEHGTVRQQPQPSAPSLETSEQSVATPEQPSQEQQPDVRSRQQFIAIVVAKLNEKYNGKIPDELSAVLFWLRKLMEEKIVKQNILKQSNDALAEEDKKLAEEIADEVLKIFNKTKIESIIKKKLVIFLTTKLFASIAEEVKQSFKSILHRYLDIQTYYEIFKERKRKKGMFLFRCCNLIAYGGSEFGYFLRFLIFLGVITVGAAAASIACAFFTMLAIVVNASTSLRCFYKECQARNNRVWIDMPWYKKIAKACALFFSYGTFGELTGGGAALCTGFIFTCIAHASALTFSWLFGVGLALTMTYYISYMAINANRDYPYTAKKGNISMTVQGALFALTGTATLLFSLKVFGAVTIPLLPVFLSTGVGGIVFGACFLALGIAALAVGIHSLCKMRQNAAIANKDKKATRPQSSDARMVNGLKQLSSRHPAPSESEIATPSSAHPSQPPQTSGNGSPHPSSLRTPSPGAVGPTLPPVEPRAPVGLRCTM